MSRVSIRKALDELVNEGLIEKIAGKGNRVKEPDEDRTPVVLRLAWFSSSYEIPIIEKMIKAFERKHPFVQVEMVLYAEDFYTETIIRSIDDGQGPDLFIMSDQHFREWTESGRTNLLTGYVPPLLREEGVSYPRVFELFNHEGGMLAAPFVSPVVICYNRSIFRQHGLPYPISLGDWKESLAAAKACTSAPDEDGMTDHYGFCFSSSPNRWPVFLLQNDGDMVADRDRSTMADQRNIEALEFCVSLMYKEHVSPIFSPWHNHLAESLFMKERVAMIMSTYYFMNEFRDHSIDWDVMTLPNGTKPATMPLEGLSINAASSHRSIAEKLVDFMTGEEAQTPLKKHGRTIPALRSVAEDDRLLNPDIHPRHYNRFLEVCLTLIRFIPLT